MTRPTRARRGLARGGRATYAPPARPSLARRSLKVAEPPFDLVQPEYGLYPYQKLAVDQILDVLQDHGRVLLHAPTGAGKTRMAMSAVSRWLRERAGQMVLWLAPTKELVGQAAHDFKSAWTHHGDVEAAVIQWHGDGEDFEYGTAMERNTMLVAGMHKAGRASSIDAWVKQSLRERVGLIVFDEAHQAVAPWYRGFVESLATAAGADRPLLGLSATPGRATPAESEALADMFRGQKVGIGDGGNPVQFLVSRGYLAEATVVTHPFGGAPPPTKKRRPDADYPKAALDALGEDDARNQKIVEITRELFEGGHKRVIVFTPSVASALKCATMMEASGHKHCYAISGKTPSDHRSYYIRTFSHPISALPSPQAIFNCNVLTAGFDAPQITAAVIGKPTKSAVRLQQMIGRALRGPKSGGMPHAEIRMIVDDSYVDFGSLADLFCQWDRLWDPLD